MDDVVKHPPGRDMIPQGTQSHGVPFGHEKSDVNARATLISMLVVLSSVAVAMLAMAGMFRYLNNREMAKNATIPQMIRETQQYPMGPPLLPSRSDDRLPWEEMEKERTDNQAIGTKLGIVDPQTGQYRIPDNALAGSGAGKDYTVNDRYKWEDTDRRFSVDSSGGLSLEKP